MPPAAKIRTRFAPSPTGYMHVGGLRTALYAYLIAKKDGGTFILRIEDTDTARYVEGATEIIIKTLRKAGLVYDEGPDIGGDFGPYIQSQRRDIYGRYARELCEKGHAYYCFCEKTDNSNDGGTQDTNVIDRIGQRTDDPCRNISAADSRQRAENGEAYVIRLRAPREGETTVNDVIFGKITVANKELDDMVLLKRDGLPTYNFANVVDDHLMGITHVVRGSEYISSAPKYNLIYNAFGWEIPVYITVSPIMRDHTHKLSKRDGDPTYDDLIGQGYIPEAILNYVALLGWSPGGENEFFTLSEMLEAFDTGGISKAPAIFDIVKLGYFSGEYIRRMPEEEFAKLADPYIKAVIKRENIDTVALACLLQTRCEKLTDISGQIDFFDNLPDYDTELFVHAKSKTDKEISLKMLQEVKSAIKTLSVWEKDTIHETLISLAQKLEVKNATLMWPLRIAAAGKAVTPGGAVEICCILGHEEVLQRIDIAITKLTGG